MKKHLLPIIVAALVALPGCTDLLTSPGDTSDNGSTLTPPENDQGSNTGNTILFILHDSTGESHGPSDVQGMLMVFDKSTGQYAIYITADTSEPFPAGQLFRININLFNVDLGTRARFPSFFSCTMNDYILTRSQTMMELHGSDPGLVSWREGNRVLTNSLRGTANPEGVTLFRSAVGDPLVGVSPSDTRTGFLDAEDTIANGPWTIAVKLQTSTKAGLAAASTLSESTVRELLRH